ncbi:MAG: DHH family phosphoesterase [Candidatus Diapherotrites archaeon]|uniref:DHH family phosphoesterase n=1 Tax=Candidatus Iainarchaeum sp. TaxID=3101447 RepID=A0A8T5GET8_9ARCH|nr:DHH family phosphoesterase [Candidatus Diapherotrites archaeon]MBT7241058.1 DHH family phosphoesterase [Candidatus Diapherotrites archaeon]
MKTIQEVKKEVMDFLELKKAKKVLLVVDDDEDGMTSAFQMKKFLEESEQKVTLHFNEKRSIAPGAINEEEEFLELVKSDDSKLIIFCDLNEEIASQKLGLIDSKIKVLIIDHHPTPKEFLIKNELMVVKPGDFSNKTPANYSATKVIFDLFNIDAIAALIGVVGDSSLGDWEEFGEKIMQENSVSLEQVTRLANVIKSIVSNYGSRKKELFEFVYEKGSFVSLLGSEYEELAKQFEELIESERKRYSTDLEKEKDVELVFFETKKGLPSKLSNVLSKENKETLIVYSKSDYIKGSVRRADFKVDSGALIKYAIMNSKLAKGGGHIPAGGFSCPADYFDEFKSRAAEFMKIQNTN